jgi:outer membrane protein OmpA-like peptidoglycan-associated protein
MLSINFITRSSAMSKLMGTTRWVAGAVGMAAWLAAHPQAPDTELARIQSLHRERRHSEALAEARKQAAARPQDPVSWFWLGVTAQSNAATTEALEAYRRALEFRPAYAEALNNLGDIYESRQEWAKAIEHYERARDANPRLGSAYAGLGDVYRKNGAWRQAAEAYRKALELEPGDALSKDFLGLCEQALREQQQGVVSAHTLETIAAKGLEVRGDSDEPRRPEPQRMAFQLQFRRDRFAVEDLLPDARRQLDEVAKVLQSEQWKGRKLVIEGHACSCGPREYNQGLAGRRGEAILAYLAEHRATTRQSASVRSFGESNPVAPTGDEQLPAEACERSEPHTQNRRVVIQGEGAVAKVLFSYRSRSGQFRPLTDGAVLRSGDQIRVYFETYDKSHVYAFHRGSAGEWTVLFPNPLYTRQAPAQNPVEARQPYWLPRQETGFPLDETPGSEETLVYVSPGPDRELEEIVLQQKPKEVKIEAKSLGLVSAGKPGDLYLPPRWTARVRFEHQR